MITTGLAVLEDGVRRPRAGQALQSPRMTLDNLSIIEAAGLQNKEGPPRNVAGGG